MNNGRLEGFNNKLSKAFGIVTSKEATAGLKAKEGDKIFSAFSNLLKKEVTESVCSPNCTECCYRPIYVYTRIEENYVLRALTDLVKPTAKAAIALSLKRLMPKWEELCFDYGMDKVSPPFPPDLDPPWIDARHPCPLLVDGLCVVYPRMPLDCRLTNHVGDPCFTTYEAGYSALESGGQLLKEAVHFCHKIDEKNGFKVRHTHLLGVLQRWLR